MTPARALLASVLVLVLLLLAVVAIGRAIDNEYGECSGPVAAGICEATP